MENENKTKNSLFLGNFRILAVMSIFPEKLESQYILIVLSILQGTFINTNLIDLDSEAPYPYHRISFIPLDTLLMLAITFVEMDN